MANDVMIDAVQLTKRYGAFRALDRVSFQVRKGEVVGFLGPNGAGKSTTMRILTCFISATSGTARVHGQDVFDDPLAVRRTIGYLPQRAPLYGEMSVWEYLSFVAEMRGLDEGTFKKRMKRIVEVCGLGQVLGKDIRTLSHGYRQRVGLGQALVHDPPILILDEPTSDLDPNEKAEVLRYIQQIGKDHTILLSTHNLSEVEAACARAIIVSKGRVVADGPLDEIRGRSGKVRYTVIVDEKRALPGKKPPTAEEVQELLGTLPGAGGVIELPTDDRAHAFRITSRLGTDLRAEIFALAVQRGWVLLEMRRETQTLEDVFKALTRGDEVKDRGRALDEDDDEEDDGALAAGSEPDDDDDDDDDEEDDDDADGDEGKEGDEEGDDDEDEDEEDDEEEEGEEGDEEDEEEEDDGDEDEEEDKKPDPKAKKKG